MKIVVVMGSPRKLETLKVVQRFEEKLVAQCEVTFNYIFLKDVCIKPCLGCFICLEKGEEFCPQRDDDRVKIFDLMTKADGVIFASPNYSLQVTALMKNFLDRMAYVFHRPCFFHKAFIPIITQGVYGGEQIIKYLETLGSFWGFNVTKGVLVTTPPGVKLPAEETKIERKITEGVHRFQKTLTGNPSPKPSIKKFIIFNLVCAFKPYGPKDRDYNYFKDKGWLEASYYYETKLPLIYRMIGRLVRTKFSKEGAKRQMLLSRLRKQDIKR
ncbi:flavodoxin family protein [Desulfosporosinus sp.]|uniref:flavodoxin family protein n=1 Tax=Desulfosporosinus sp. TaxID=157907 RepID=UPI0025C02132|nr:flavodoxin family protein [Desulfosporosinus sp.]MBC2723358.1 flavodoxin family protein [Desulfosporosinus sp.]MBC2727998.1 flavodoxin family protein [Desulfosporosinus sp.]